MSPMSPNQDLGTLCCRWHTVQRASEALAGLSPAKNPPSIPAARLDEQSLGCQEKGECLGGIAGG